MGWLVSSRLPLDQPVEAICRLQPPPESEWVASLQSAGSAQHAAIPVFSSLQEWPAGVPFTDEFGGGPPPSPDMIQIGWTGDSGQSLGSFTDHPFFRGRPDDGFPGMSGLFCGQ